MAIENDIFMSIYTSIKEIGYDVYIGNPIRDVKYPFLYIGEQITTGVRSHKDHSDKDTDITIHLWHNRLNERGTFYNIIEDVENLIIGRYKVRGEDIGLRVIGDPEDLSLMHGIIEIELKNIKGEDRNE